MLLTTQYLDEADQLADRIAVIDDGKVIAEGIPGELKNSVGSGVMRLRLREPEARPEARRVLSRSLGVALTDFSLGQPSLDEVFLALTGHSAEEGTDNEEEEAV